MAEDKQIQDSEALKLSDQQMDQVRLADAQFERGLAFSPEEVRDMARRRTLSWMQKAPGKSA